MQYREYGKLGYKVSAFGMGCMRPPMKVAEDGTVVRTISGKVRPGTAAVSADGHGLRVDVVPDREGKFSIPLTLPVLRRLRESEAAKKVSKT